MSTDSYSTIFPYSTIFRDGVVGVGGGDGVPSVVSCQTRGPFARSLSQPPSVSTTSGTQEILLRVQVLRCLAGIGLLEQV